MAKEISTGGFNMKHDILCDLGDKGIFVLDTKYKQIQRFEGHDEHEISRIVNDEVLKATYIKLLLMHQKEIQIKLIYYIQPIDLKI